ncbi:hypothetical protein V8C35DRAFT_312311 [Trichoderma chlorosporum]
MPFEAQTAHVWCRLTEVQSAVGRFILSLVFASTLAYSLSFFFPPYWPFQCPLTQNRSLYLESVDVTALAANPSRKHGFS